MDRTKSEAFAEKMLAVVNAGGLALMTSIGHRTGLFDLMAKTPPATSAEIAERAGLQERYVREWLGAMVTGGVVEFEPHERRYRLPAEHAAWLTREATPNNLATTTQWISVLGQVEDRLVECFRSGGGVPYSEYARFHEVMAEESTQTVVAALTGHILPLLPDLTAALERGIDVLDVGCGAGRAINRLAELFPRSRFTGYDFSSQAIEAGRAEARHRELTNVRLETKDAAALGEREQYDLITAFDAIHDQARPDEVLRQIAAALRGGGTFLMQDIRASSHLERNADHPLAPFLYTISCMHCMTVSLSQGGAGLGACWGEELAQQMLGEAGFQSVGVHHLPHDIQNTYYVARKP